MATALQCPDCGNRHRLDALGDRTVFACAQCSRPLKVPAAYRPGANGASGNGNGTNGSGGPVPAEVRATRRRPARHRGDATMSTPVRILLWVLAFALGAVVVRMIAKWTGFVGGNTLVDLLIDHSFSNYFRLFVLVPFWALFSTVFLTVFLEGPGWYRRRRAGVPITPAGASTTGAAKATAGSATAGAATAGAATRATRSGAGPIPTRVPAGPDAVAAAAGRPRTIQRRGEAAPEPVRAAVAAPVPDDRTQALAVGPVVAAPVPPATEPDDEYAVRAASGHRPRRIPRRDTGS